MSRKQSVILVSVAFILTIGLLSVRGQEKNSELKDKRIAIQMADKPLLAVFGRLIYKYDIAIGFEESTLDRVHRDYQFETNIPTDKWKAQINVDGEFKGEHIPRPEGHLITVDFKDAPLKDVMNAIVGQMKNYDWEINNDVVNIFPVRGRDPKFVQLLDLKVREFALWKNAEVGFIQTFIFLLPEFKTFLAKNNLRINSLRTFSLWFIERPLPEGMRFSGLTFRELLNAITRSKRGGWILETKKKNVGSQDEEFIDILI